MTPPIPPLVSLLMKVQKKKLWEGVQPDLKTDDSKVAGYKGLPMLTSAGAVTAPTLSKANIS